MTHQCIKFLWFSTQMSSTHTPIKSEISNKPQKKKKINYKIGVKIALGLGIYINALKMT